MITDVIDQAFSPLLTSPGNPTNWSEKWKLQSSPNQQQCSKIAIDGCW